METAVMDPPAEAVVENVAPEQPESVEQPTDQPVAESAAETASDTPRPSTMPPPPTEEELEEARRGHYLAICEREREVRSIESSYESLKAQSNQAKKEFDTADTALRWLIAQGPRVPEKFPLRVRAAKNLIMPKMNIGDEFDVVECGTYSHTVKIITDPDHAPDGDWVKLGNEVDAVTWGARPEAPPEPVEEAEDESWREELLSNSIKITEHQLKALAEVSVSTVGQFEDFRTKVASSEAVWPKGLGEAKISKLTDAVLDWLKEWRSQADAGDEGDA